MAFDVSPIGIVRSDRAEVVDDNWGSVEAVIDLDASVLDADATLGLDEFSHLEVVYGFHLCDPAATTTGSRHPRGDTTLPRCPRSTGQGSAQSSRGVSVRDRRRRRTAHPSARSRRDRRLTGVRRQAVPAIDGS